MHNLGRLHRTSSLAYGLSADGDAASKASAAALTAVSGTSGTDHEHDEHDDLNVDVDDVDEDAIVKKQKIKHRLIISPTRTGTPPARRAACRQAPSSASALPSCDTLR